MAERLPGLTDPNAPPASSPRRPGKDQADAQSRARRPPAPKLLHPLHPDRFTPGA
jgi:rod shape-determining protein MreC